MEMVVKHWNRMPRAVVRVFNHPWNCSKNKWMRHLRTWFGGEQGGAGLMFGLDDIKGLFQP